MSLKIKEGLKMSLIKYTCQLIQRHMTLTFQMHKTEDEKDELVWLDYKIRLVKRAQRRSYTHV